MPVDGENENLCFNNIRKRYTTEHTLKNDRSIIFRPIEPTDKSRYDEFFKSLSPESIHMRFFCIIKELSNEELEKYCNPNYNQEISIVALPKDENKIIATSRLIFANREKAEFDIAVTDTWQGIGLGSELLNYTIQIARDYKLKEIYYFIASENYKMLRLSKKISAKVKSSDGDMLEMSLQLS